MESAPGKQLLRKMEIENGTLLNTALFLAYLTTIFNCLDHIVSNVNIVAKEDLEMVWKEAVVAYFKVLFQLSVRSNEKNNEKPQSHQPVTGPRTEPGASQIQSRSTFE
jgi:hypothetical protein